MKYDLKRLKNAVDQQIPEIPMDGGLPAAARQAGRRPCERYLTGALTAAAACMLIFAILGSLLEPGMTGYPDDVGQGGYALSQGGLPGALPGEKKLPKETQPPRQINQAVEIAEELDGYQQYSPLYAAVALPGEITFGDVTIKKTEDQKFIFVDAKTGDRVLPDEYDQGFAWFPATQTGLVGNFEGMALIGRGGFITDYVYTHFDYQGGGVAIAAEGDLDQTEPQGMFVVSTANGRKLTATYPLLGTMRSGSSRFLLGHDDWEGTSDLDVMDMTGRVIARVSSVYGLYFDKWLAVTLPGEENYCLIDLDGNIQLDGQRFATIWSEKNGYLVVHVNDKGFGVIDESGEWVFEPGEYLWIEVGENGLFVVRDRNTAEQRQINAQGQDVSTLKFKMRQALNAVGEAYSEWRRSVGEFGYWVICALCWWLLMRIGFARRNGELVYFRDVELGLAVYAAGLMFISHRNTVGYWQLWPTNTLTAGASGMAVGWMAVSVCAMVALAKSYEKLRTPKRMFLVGYAAMLLPWIIKAACMDMSVENWQTMSLLVFAGGVILAVCLWKWEKVKQTVEEFSRYDSMNEYKQGVRIVWYVILAAALINFGVGCWISGQEVGEGGLSFWVNEYGMPGTVATDNGYDEEWVSEVNRIRAEYPDGYDEKWPEDALQFNAVVAAEWLRENGLDELKPEMIYSVRVSGKANLKRPARVQLILEPDHGADRRGIRLLAADYPQAEEDGSVESWAVFLIPPKKRPGGSISGLDHYFLSSEELPDVIGWLSIHQKHPLDDYFAAQTIYKADLGMMLEGQVAAEALSLEPEEETDNRAVGIPEINFGKKNRNEE